MTSHRLSTTFSIPITSDFHQIAQQFYQHHSDAQKAKQVYLNTLSVQAAKFYLTCLGIDTNLEKSDCWDPVVQVLSNAADLWITDLGRLECCGVLPDQIHFKISEEAQEDRIGYLFVQFNEALTEATLLGFLTQLQPSVVTLQMLQPMDSFPGYLTHATPGGVTPMPFPTKLQHWLDDIADEGWTRLSQILDDWQTQMPAFSFRTSLVNRELIEPETTGVKQGKFLIFSHVAETQVLLLVGITPVQKEQTFDITVELYPAGQQTYLPPSLKLVVMDEGQMPVLQAEGRQSKGLEFQFSAEAGETFTVQISLNQALITELFYV